MLFQILSASGQLARWPPPGEAHQLWEMEYHPALTGWDSNVLGAEEATPEVASRIRRDAVLMVGAKRPMLEKAPRNSLRVPFLEALFPDARYVQLQRDGRENVNSLINAWRTHRYRTYRLPEPHSIPGCDPNWWKFVLYPGWRADARGPVEVVCAKQWIASNEHALDALAVVPEERRTVVRYDDLVADPIAEVERLMTFLGLVADPDVRARAERSREVPVNVVTPPELGKWKRENPQEIRSIEPLIAPTMERLGYA